MKKIIGFALSVIVLSTICGGSLHAQSYAESALMFSRTQSAGSARILGLGGAQVALGGDYSSALSNPAGLGMYNRSEFTFSPALNFYNTKSDYLNNSTTEDMSKFNIPGLSYVHHFEPRREGDFQGGSFGISFSRINDFNRSTLYSGHNETNSIVDYFIDQANGATTAQFDNENYNTPTGLAFYNFLIGPTSEIDPDGSDTDYFTDAPLGAIQQEEIRTKGTSYQWSFSYGANFKDMFYFGGGIGLTTLRYKSTKIFSEDYDFKRDINSMQLTENLDLSGSGINVTLGTIIRPASFVQLGLSFTSPTYYQISENYDASMSTRWNNFQYNAQKTLNNESAKTDIVTSDYSLTTPLKLNAGITFLSKYGFITGEVERTNAGQARYSSDTNDVSFTSDNKEIKAAYDAVWNYRVGVELRYSVMRLRGGYNIQNNPFKNSSIDGKIETMSGGIGVKLKKFSVDFTLLSRKGNNNYAPYSVLDRANTPDVDESQQVPVAHFVNKFTAGMLTFGFTF